MYTRRHQMSVYITTLQILWYVGVQCTISHLSMMVDSCIAIIDHQQSSLFSISNIKHHYHHQPASTTGINHQQSSSSTNINHDQPLPPLLRIRVTSPREEVFLDPRDLWSRGKSLLLVSLEHPEGRCRDDAPRISKLKSVPRCVDWSRNGTAKWWF